MIAAESSTALRQQIQLPATDPTACLAHGLEGIQHILENVPEARTVPHTRTHPSRMSAQSQPAANSRAAIFCLLLGHQSSKQNKCDIYTGAPRAPHERRACICTLVQCSVCSSCGVHGTAGTHQAISSNRRPAGSGI